MGQRLNIEITNGQELLANAYYHWSGYTTSALRLTKIIMNEIKKHINEAIIKEDNKEKNNLESIISVINRIQESRSSILLACKLLKSTGATLTEGEINYIKENFDESFAELYNNDDNDRNNGLIAVSEKEMENTRTWEEARVTIDLLYESINFGAVYTMSKDEFIEEGFKDIEDIAKVDFNIFDIYFDKFDSAFNTLYDLATTEVAIMSYGQIIGFIE